jgi:2-polyprenyl-3-methyl-5-hydroxy-6-metoxy-1,4-benzoquinol methylase
MLEKIIHCPICDNGKFDEYIISKDYLVTGESFTIVKCSQCDFVFTNPRPDKENLANYYKSDQYISHTDKSNNLLNTLYKTARVFTLKRKERLVRTLVEEKSIFDYGCGTGDFLKVCHKKSWKIYGFELDAQAASIAQQKTGIKIINEISQINEINNVSLITMWHVLEHISDLNDTIKQLVNVLKEDGKMLIAVPNINSYDADYYQDTWAAYDLPRHLYHFTQETMEKLMKKHDLKIVDILPMKLDSFYVSLLSEKYKTGQSNYIKSIINGCKSNIYAKKSQKNYSSLIYIASK